MRQPPQLDLVILLRGTAGLFDWVLLGVEPELRVNGIGNGHVGDVADVHQEDLEICKLFRNPFPEFTSLQVRFDLSFLLPQ